MTLEEAQEKIIELTEQVQALQIERDNLGESLQSLGEETEALRLCNQRYFNKLIAQEEATKNKGEDPEGEDIISCEEFAKTISI